MNLRPTAFSVFALALIFALATPPAEAARKAYGSPLKTAETTSIARLLADPSSFAGKVVRVEGSVLDVCPKAGCWMEVGSKEGAVRIKVEDGVIVFPVDAKGRAAVAEGKVEIIEMTREQYTRWAEHLAEERGEAFDPKTVGSGPFRLVQIKGTGAEIEGP